jgi:hypothetical protein
LGVLNSPLIDSPLIDSPLIDSPVIDSPLNDSPLIDSPVIDSIEGYQMTFYLYRHNPRESITSESITGESIRDHRRVTRYQRIVSVKKKGHLITFNKVNYR